MEDQAAQPHGVPPEVYATLLSVNAARAAIGLPTIPQDQYTEFGWLDRLTTAMRSKIAKQSIAEGKFIRNPKTGRWMEKRGTLKLPGKSGAPGKARATTALQDGDALNLPSNNNPGRRLSVPGKRRYSSQRLPKPASSPSVPVTRLTSAQARRQLREAGYEEAEIHGWTERGVVFRVEHGGRNPVYVFSAHPDGLIAGQNIQQRQAVQESIDNLNLIAARYAAKIRAGDRRATKLYEEAERRLHQARWELQQRNRKLEDIYGTGGEEMIDNYDRGLAEEAGAILAHDMQHWPPWLLTTSDGRPRPMMIEFDEAKLAKMVEQGNAENPEDVIAGYAPRGKSIIAVDRFSFRQPMDSERGAALKKSLGPVSGETVGQQTIIHEAGHVQDDRHPDTSRTKGWDSNQQAFDEFMQETLKHIQIKYVKDLVDMGEAAQGRPNREWWAEMNRVARRGLEGDQPMTPHQQAALNAFRSLFMLSMDSRPAQPTPQWIAAHSQWLRAANLALKVGRSLPPLPNPKNPAYNFKGYNGSPRPTGPAKPLKQRRLTSGAAPWGR